MSRNSLQPLSPLFLCSPLIQLVCCLFCPSPHFFHIHLGSNSSLIFQLVYLFTESFDVGLWELLALHQVLNPTVNVADIREAHDDRSLKINEVMLRTRENASRRGQESACVRILKGIPKNKDEEETRIRLKTGFPFRCRRC